MSVSVTGAPQAAPWVASARRAIDGGASAGDVDVLERRRPPLLDFEGARALLAPLLAVVTWAVAVLRDAMVADLLDPIGLLVRLLALVLTVRAILLGARWLRRLRVWLETPRYELALTPEGMLLRQPAGELALGRDDLLDVRERGDWRGRSVGRRYREVYLVLRPDHPAAPFVAIPPVFERTPGVLAERLMRWRGVPDVPEEAAHPPPHELASEVYERSAAGRPPPGSTVIRHGTGWLARGPYATILLAALLLERLVRLPATTWQSLSLVYPLALAACLVAVPAIWVVLTRRHVRPRLGLALVMTPAEILMRTRAGTLRVHWSRLTRASVDAAGAWSLLEGYHAARRLVLERTDAEPIRYEEAFLGVPAEVAQALCEAYKKGAYPGPSSA